MIISVDVNTGEITELPDAPVTWVEPVIIAPTPPTKEELMAQLLAIQTQIQAL